MTTPDIVGLCKRLRAEEIGPEDLSEAADTIERQAAEIERLRGALEPFADLADEFSVCGDGQPIGVKAVSGQSDLNVGHLRRAAEAFK